MIQRYIYFQQFSNLIFFIYLSTMQELQLLPRRNSQQRVKFRNADQTIFFTNLYQVKLNSKNQTVYQFVVETTPEIPQDSAHLFRLIYKKINKELRELLQDFIANGLQIWSFQNLTKPTTYQAEFTQAQHLYKFDVLVKPVKQFSFTEFFKDVVKRNMILQIANSKVKNTLKSQKYAELGKGKYFKDDPKIVKNLGLQVLRGFKLTLCPIGNQLLMQVDVCSKISRSDNILAELMRYNAQTANNLFRGAIVITRYGNLRTFKIEQIDYDLNPSKRFFKEKQAGQISYAQYYLKSYGRKIFDMKQPLIKTISRYDRKIIDKKMVQTPIYIYLIPQLVSFTGMSDAHRADHNAMKDIAPYTKLQPKQRAEANQGLIDEFNKDDTNTFIKINGQRNARGVLLSPVEISLGNGNVFTKDGTFMFKNKIKSPAKFKDWVFCYSLSNNPKYDEGDSNKAVDLFMKCAPAFGITFEDPGFIEIKGKSPADWKNQIQADIKSNGKPQIIVLFLQKHEEKFYGQLKRFLTVQHKIPSQAIRRRTLTNQVPARNMSAASKIILQMNAKLGLPLWEIPESSKTFGKKKIMYGGISISKGPGGFTLAFVGTIDKTCTKVYSQAVIGIKKKQQIPQTIFDSIFKNWARTYYQNTKSVPDLIIIYRQGLTEAQIKKTAGPQIKSLQKTVETIGIKTKVKDYNPQILFVGVNKKINMRFYNINGKQQGGKFIPNLSNPDSGSVIVEDLSVGNLIDFHLAAQKVTQGTCTPTQYITIYKNFDLSMEELVEFTYGQCFNYYNWTGAVRVPSCLQCADKLAKLVGQSIKQDISNLGQIDSTYHFL